MKAFWGSPSMWTSAVLVTHCHKLSLHRIPWTHHLQAQLDFFEFSSQTSRYRPDGWEILCKTTEISNEHSEFLRSDGAIQQSRIHSSRRIVISVQRLSSIYFGFRRDGWTNSYTGLMTWTASMVWAARSCSEDVGKLSPSFLFQFIAFYYADIVNTPYSSGAYSCHN